MRMSSLRKLMNCCHKRFLTSYIKTNVNSELPSCLNTLPKYCTYYRPTCTKYQIKYQWRVLRVILKGRNRNEHFLAAPTWTCWPKASFKHQAIIIISSYIRTILRALKFWRLDNRGCYVGYCVYECVPEIFRPKIALSGKTSSYGTDLSSVGVKLCTEAIKFDI